MGGEKMSLLNELKRIAKKEKLDREERVSLFMSNIEQLTTNDILTIIRLQLIYFDFYNNVVTCVDRAEDEFFD